MSNLTTKIDQMTVGQRLRWLLEIRGGSIKDLSDASGIKYGTLQQYLSDKRQPGASQLAGLAEAGIDLHWLLLGQQGNTLKLAFDELKKLQGPLVADYELYDVFLRRALDTVDVFHGQWNKSRNKILSIHYLLHATWLVLSMYSDILEKISEKIIDLRKKGWSGEEIADFVISDPVHKITTDFLSKVTHAYLDSAHEDGAQ
jgi:transcriptional regulator with XRE-family HTH domain